MAVRMDHVLWVYICVLSAGVLVRQTDGLRWLAIRQLNLSKWDGAACREARLRGGLSPRQATLCRSAVASAAASASATAPSPQVQGTPTTNGATTPSGIMPLLERAAALAVTTCQAVLTDRRWNCSSLEMTPKLGPDLTSGTREQAFAFAMASAAVAHTMARACAQGALFQCSCAAPPRDAPDGDFKWGGCGDNVRWGAAYAKQWTDAASGRRRRKQMTSVNAKRNKSKMAPINRKSRRKRRPVGSALLAMVNQHNSRAGWRAVESSVATQCKCHGVSGSCSLKTCWRAVPRLGDIGSRLLRRFASAVEVEGRRPAGAAPRRLVAVVATASNLVGNGAPIGSNGALSVAPPPPPPPATGRRFSVEDLVFVTKSPDYCEPDSRTGSAGTKGRTCNATSSGFDSCVDMCCGRGFHTVIIRRTEMCQCQHVWCCYVRCNTCEYMVDTHFCN